MKKKQGLTFFSFWSRIEKSFKMAFAGVAELADAPDLGSGGRPWGFKSLRLYSDKKPL